MKTYYVAFAFGVVYVKLLSHLLNIPLWIIKKDKLLQSVSAPFTKKVIPPSLA